MNRLPPGPSLLSFLLRYPSDPPAYYAACEKKYGPIFTGQTVFGPVVVTGDPEAARTIYAAPPDAIEAFAPQMFEPFLGDKSMIVMSGAEHARARKLVMPPFHGERMRSYAQIVSSTAKRLFAATPLNKPFPVLSVTQRITLEVMFEAVLGLSVEKDPETCAELADAIFDFVNAMAPSIVFVPALRRDFCGVGPWARFTKARKRLDEIVYRIMDWKNPTGGDTSIMGMLKNARDEEGFVLGAQELRDELLTLLFAGHETTAIGLAWAFYHLLREPRELGLLLDELRAADAAPEALAKLPRLEAICNEALRVYPVVVDVPRTLKRPMRLCGYDIPAGMSVSASPLLLHRNPATFPFADRFWPDRFLERKYGPGEFAPFGGGNRRCIGAAFAMYEMKIVLGTVLREGFVFRLASGRPEPWKRRGAVMAPGDGVPLIRDT